MQITGLKKANEYSWSGPYLGMVWANTENPVYEIEINEIKKNLALRAGRGVHALSHRISFMSSQTPKPRCPNPLILMIQIRRQVSVPPNLEGQVTKFAPHKALKLIAWCKLTFDEKFELHRVEPQDPQF